MVVRVVPNAPNAFCGQTAPLRPVTSLSKPPVKVACPSKDVSGP